MEEAKAVEEDGEEEEGGGEDGDDAGGLRSGGGRGYAPDPGGVAFDDDNEMYDDAYGPFDGGIY